MPTNLNYYQLLDLKPEASSDEIRCAYRLKSKVYHPDTTTLAQEVAIQKFQLLKQAYDTLSNPELRQNYDYQLGLSTSKGCIPRAATHLKSQPISSLIEIQERPLSAGELVALLILGLTFLGCLALALILGFTRGDMMLQGSPVATNMCGHLQV
ncbi:J domain-containing protein [Acaryochloris sp. IP29b_bin.148]|uniref:J domain-containing protein n=1 Tax=Acaryochloris sp. IP29b_bin.148 TaxID=2969218 RepID=UPI00260A8B58|nr:J domain-containing protein [Acaryochloris sp. IP29b_bin.148]